MLAENYNSLWNEYEKLNKEAVNREDTYNKLFSANPSVGVYSPF